MSSAPDLTVNTGMLIDRLVDAATERGILIADNASLEELANSQKTVDILTEEVFRRTSW